MAPPLVTRLSSPVLDGMDTGLWLVALDVALDAARVEATLSAAEKARAARFRFERDARRYRVSHMALRQVLSEQTGLPPAALDFQEGQFGKPRLTQTAAPHFNMSHSGDWALIGVSATGPLGVDIEAHAPMEDVQALAERNYTVAERESLRASKDPLTDFLRCWTRKEACLKALGSGLSIEPNVFETGTDAGMRSTTVEGCPMAVASVALPVNALAACAWIAPSDRHWEL